MSRYLMCEPRGGMGNRMLSILCCLAAAKQTDRSAVIVWHMDEFPNAHGLRLGDLWECTGFQVWGPAKANKRLETGNPVRYPLHQAQRGPEFSVAGPQPLVHIYGHGFLACKECRDQLQLKTLFEQHFKLADKLQEVADETKEKHFRQRTVAAYVRAGTSSHPRTKQWNPLKHFSEFATVVLKQPETNIFVACDCPRAAEKIRQKFPVDRIIIPWVPQPDTVRSWKRAAINVHLCIAADEFYGSRVSMCTDWIGLLRGDTKVQFLDDVYLPTATR